MIRKRKIDWRCFNGFAAAAAFTVATWVMTACSPGDVQDVLEEEEEDSCTAGYENQDLVFVTAAATDQVFTVLHDRSTGSLELLATTDLPEDENGNDADSLGVGKFPFDVAVHPTGKFVYTANTRDWEGYGSISAFSVDTDTGALTPVGEALEMMDWSNEDLPEDDNEAALPVSLAISADGTLLVAEDNNNDFLRFFTIDSVTGALTEFETPSVHHTADHGPIAHPSLNIFYQGPGVSGQVDGVWTVASNEVDDYWVDADHVTINGAPGIMTVSYDGSMNMFDITDPMVPAAFDDYVPTTLSDSNSLALEDTRAIQVKSDSTAFYVNDLWTARIQAFSINADDLSSFAPLGAVSVLYDAETVTTGMVRDMKLNSDDSFMIASSATNHGDAEIDAQPNAVYAVKVNADGSLESAPVSTLTLPDGVSSRFLEVTPRCH